MKKIGVVVFPGSNCDHDLYYVIKHELKKDVEFVWHKESNLADYAAVFLPGGFSYGDYLRGGAIARFSPVMNEVIRFANSGKPVMGICNGFQVLCEAGLLPGALLKNDTLEFVCQHVNVRVTSPDSIFTRACKDGQVLNVPIAHGEGNYFANTEQLHELEEHDQIVFQYATVEGQVSPDANPNGSRLNVAGICNKNRNVLGMMPHPERAASPLLESMDGRVIFESLLAC